MRFRDIPQFTRQAPYHFHCPWNNIESWLNSHSKDTGLVLDLNPDFQRDYVWTVDKQIAYIEFILRGG